MNEKSSKKNEAENVFKSKSSMALSTMVKHLIFRT